MNWREARFDTGELKALLPCKPDKADKQVNFNGTETRLRMIGCETGGMLFAVSALSLPINTASSDVIEQWKSSVIGSMKAVEFRYFPFSIKGENPAELGVKLQAQGKSQDGKPLTLVAVWFVQNKQIFHAAVYAERMQDEAVETFLSGLVLP